MGQQGEHEGLFNGNQHKIRPGGSPYSELSIQRPGWTKLLILAGVSTTLGLSLPVGYNIGVVNTPATIIRAFCNESIYTRYNIALNKRAVDVIWSFIVSIFLVGAAIGSLGGSVFADKIGRRGVLIVCAALASLAAISFFICKGFNSLEILMLGRMLAGLSAGLTTCVVPMYLTELAPLHLKGATGVLCPLGVTIGVLLGQIVSMQNILGDKDYWPHCLSAYALPLLVSLATLPLLPESPKYLYVIKKERQAALTELQKIRNTKMDALQEEIAQLKLEQEDNDRTNRVTWNIGKVLVDKSLMLPLLLVCSLQAGQQLSGINAVFYYSSDIFKAAGLSVAASELATIGAGCCNFFMAAVSIPLMSKVNRRTCIQISMAFSISSLVILGFATMFINTYTWVPYISIIAVLAYVVCYGIGLGPIPYFIGSELFEVGPRPSAMALGSMSNWGANFIIGLTFPTLQTCIGSACFFIFAGITALLFVFVRVYLPETRGKDTIEVAHKCQHGFSSKPLSSNYNSNSVDANAMELKNLQNGDA